MPATYRIVPRDVPSNQRTMLITDVEAGDQIDIVEILGRPARQVQMFMTDATDTVEYRLNHHKKIRPNLPETPYYSSVYQSLGYSEPVEVWIHSDAYPVYESTGAEVIETAEGLAVSAIEIESLTLSVGTTIEIVVM